MSARREEIASAETTVGPPEEAAAPGTPLLGYSGLLGGQPLPLGAVSGPEVSDEVPAVVVKLNASLEGGELLLQHEADGV